MSPIPSVSVDTSSRISCVPRLRVGIDIVQVSRIAASFGEFGQRFLNRLFTDDEVSYATSIPALTAKRLAARFAAKEAALKAFDLGEAGVDWRDIEVRQEPEGACRLVLHGKAAALSGASGDDIALSLSHDGDYATAFVAVSPSKNSSL